MKILPAALGAASLAACSPGVETSEPLASGTVLSAAENGQSITFVNTSRFGVELLTVPTAGYRYEVEAIPDFLTRLDQDAFRAENPEFQNQEGVTGGNHFQTLFFEVSGTGSGELKLTEKREWEAATPQDKEWAVTVNAIAASED